MRQRIRRQAGSSGGTSNQAGMGPKAALTHSTWAAAAAAPAAPRAARCRCCCCRWRCCRCRWRCCSRRRCRRRCCPQKRWRAAAARAAACAAPQHFAVALFAAPASSSWVGVQQVRRRRRRRRAAAPCGLPPAPSTAGRWHAAGAPVQTTCLQAAACRWWRRQWDLAGPLLATARTYRWAQSRRPLGVAWIVCSLQSSGREMPRGRQGLGRALWFGGRRLEASRACLSMLTAFAARSRWIDRSKAGLGDHRLPVPPGRPIRACERRAALKSQKQVIVAS